MLTSLLFCSGDVIHTEHTGKGDKWIFVVDPIGTFYVAKKVRGKFHHSSFLSGACAKAAGNLTVHHGQLVRISPSSGHYRPSQADHEWFLHLLRMRGTDLETVLIDMKE